MEKQTWDIVCPHRYQFSGKGFYYCDESSRIKDSKHALLCESKNCPLKSRPLCLYYVVHDSKRGRTIHHFTSKLKHANLPERKVIAEILGITYKPHLRDESFRVYEVVDSSRPYTLTLSNVNSIKCIDDMVEILRRDYANNQVNGKGRV